MWKKFCKYCLAAAVIFLIGGVAGALAERVVLPWMSTKESLRKYKFLQKMNEKVTVINRTEQVTVKEDFSVVKTSQNVLPTIVSIITYDDTAAEIPLKIKASQDIQKSIKTGLILTSDGLIMSVLDEEASSGWNELDTRKYKILASDGREFDAQIKAVDPYAGLVFYKADASNLPSIMFGNSDELESGEKIIIAGNATGEYQNTFSLGIVKERDRTFTLLNSELSSSEKMEGAITTDAQIDHRNIGGPVIDFNGSVVGIANAIDKDGKKVGFIVPVNSVKVAIDRIIRDGAIKRPVLGVYYLSINREIALLNHLPVSQGALVYSFTGQQGLAVIKNSPADLAGLKIGDIILEVNGEKVDLEHPLSMLVAKQASLAEIQLKVMRSGKESELKARLN